VNIKKHIPNFFTLLNLSCGSIGVVQVFEGDLTIAAILIFTAAFFDLADGMTARLLKAYSKIGKELDSLADLISFGLLPASIMYYYLQEVSSNEFVPYLAFMIAAFSALRLAKFNIDERQADSFIGLPTPANALLIASFPLMENPQPLGNNEILLLGFIALSCYLLVSEIKLLSLKFKSFSWQANRLRYVLIITSVALFAFLSWAAIPWIILAYIIFSIFGNYFSRFFR